jgi:carboxypeptidase PM20D1
MAFVQDYIYGRGAIDDKHSAFGILEALNYMAAKEEQPERTLYVALGHDEEVGGDEGAGHLAKVLEEQERNTLCKPISSK